MTEGKKALHRENLYDFFHTMLEDASTRNPPPVSPGTTTYLAQLLVRLGETEAILLKQDAPRTLAELHMAAREAPRARALRLYRHLGDYALTVAGYFGDSLNRRTVGVRYYSEMGGAAYDQVLQLSSGGAFAASPSQDPWLQVFLELSRRFEHCRELLGDVSERNRAEADNDIARVYERFLRTGSGHAARRLTQLGVLPNGSTADS